ncbi:hypothetical protein [Streptomyces sp. SID12488]|nr:hypothetical protein [Streptomyces sp. SID12488]
MCCRRAGWRGASVRYETAEAPAGKTFEEGASLVVFGTEYEAVDL